MEGMGTILSRVWLVLGAVFTVVLIDKGMLTLSSAAFMFVVFALPFLLLHWPTQRNREARERWRSRRG